MSPITIRSAENFGAEIRRLRSALGMTQLELAAASGVGERFIVDLEAGKPTCQLGKALRVMAMLAQGVAVVQRHEQTAV